MALTDKNILITPNIGQTADPKIVFSGADASTGPQNITLQVYPNNSGTLSFEGSAGQLFSITNSMSGTIYSVNDVSGIPSIEVLDTGLVKLAQYSGNVVLGSATDNGTDKLQANGSIIGTILKSSVASGTAPLTVTSNTVVTNLNADLLDGNHASAFYLASNPSGYTTNTGTVTSVSGTGTVSGLSISGTVTTTGNITLSGTLSVTPSNFASQTANTVLAAPNGSNGTPTFRTLVAADIPTLNQSTTGNAGTVTNGVYTTGSYADPAWITSINYSKLTGTVPTWNQNTTGSAATLTTARTLTIGSTGKTFNGGADVTWTLADIGAAASSHSHYVGTTAVQASSANQALTGITSITGGTTGTTSLIIRTSDNSTAGSYTGGILIKTGNATGGGDAFAGDIAMYPGTSDGSAAVVTIKGGDSASGTTSAGGYVTIKGGDSTTTTGTTTASGGHLYLYGGSVTSSNSFTKTTGSVYIEGGGATGSGTITYGIVRIGASSGNSLYGTSAVDIGNGLITTTINGTVKLPNVGTSGFVKLGTGGQLSADTNSYALSSHTHPYLPLTGGTMTGNIDFSDTGEGVTWTMNTDAAYIKFFNTADGDTNSRLEYSTSDNSDEYHRWVISTNEKMNLKNDALNVTVGKISVGSTSTYMIRNSTTGALEFYV
jgi:hypothetical protein